MTRSSAIGVTIVQSCVDYGNICVLSGISVPDVNTTRTTVISVEERGPVRPYQPLTLVGLSSLLSNADESLRWRLVAEFLEEFRWEVPGLRLALLADEPGEIGDEHWDVFVAALAEHLAARDGRSGPAWSETRTLRRFWFPFNTRSARVDAVVNAPAAFRRRGVFVAARELEVV